MKRLVALLLLGALLLTLGAWALFDHLVLIWVTVLGTFVKGTVFIWVVALVRRWFFVELPKLVLFFLLRVGVPNRIRARVNLAIKLSKLWIVTTARTTIGKTQQLIGTRTSYALAIILTVAVSVLAFVFAGAYVVWIVGPAQVLEVLLWVMRPITRWLQHFLFKLFANTGLLRVWKFVMSLVPLKFRRSLRAFWGNAIRVRKRTVRRIEKRMKVKQSLVE